jgi:hypothetical protein
LTSLIVPPMLFTIPAVIVGVASGKWWIQDQAFPKKVADQYFAIQSDVLQGKVTPAEAAKQMQSAVSAWAKS